MIETRFAEEGDLEWLARKDDVVSREWVARCISHQEVVVAVENERPVGFLRFSLFWGRIPYMDMIRVEEGHQRKGVGTRLLRFREEEMKAKGAKVLMTSSVLHETGPQEWHRHNGFEECGKLTFGRQEAAPEVFFIKNLAE